LSTFDLGYVLQDQTETYQKLAHETVSLIIIDELKYLAENIDKSENVLSSESNKRIDLKKDIIPLKNTNLPNLKSIKFNEIIIIEHKKFGVFPNFLWRFSLFA
jgi:hypothetical protein